MSHILQLKPSIPMLVVGKGTGEAFMVLDYGKEDHLMWVIAMDDTGEIWTVPNPDVRFLENYTIGRIIKKKKK